MTAHTERERGLVTKQRSNLTYRMKSDYFNLPKSVPSVIIIQGHKCVDTVPKHFDEIGFTSASMRKIDGKEKKENRFHKCIYEENRR